MEQENKYWLSFTDSAEFQGSEPAFFNRDELPWLKPIEENYSVIKNELLQLVQDEKNLIPYFNKTLTEKLTWKIFPLLVWERKYVSNIAKCPKTYELLNKCPGLLSASFSVLDPHTDIKPHYGDSNIMYRCHLGLIIPAGFPECGIEVKGEQRGWEEGKAFAFCDAHFHRAWNKTDSRRVVLIFDVLRPQFADRKEEIVSRVKVSLFWLHFFQSSAIISKLPFFIKKLMVRIPAFFISLF